MSKFKELRISDKKRNTDSYSKRLLYWFRKYQCSKTFFKHFYKLMYGLVALSHGNEIGIRTKIGKGFYIGHPYNLTVNGNTIIGDNCNIHKGVLIGQENRGRRKGTPVIGNSVWIGINACIVGNITIGDDVLIAPNAYVNCDVPSHSVVIGNPCIIKPKGNATEDYINNKI